MAHGPLGKGKTQQRPKLISRIQKGEIAVPKEMMSTSRQMGRLGETVSNGIDRAKFNVRGVIIGGGIAGILAGSCNGNGRNVLRRRKWLRILPSGAEHCCNLVWGERAFGRRRGVDRRFGYPPWHVGLLGGVVFAALPSSRKSATVALLSGLVWGVVVWASSVHRSHALAQPNDVRGNCRKGNLSGGSFCT